MQLTRSFFNRPTLDVARELIGCFIVREIKGKKVRARIVETEAYVGVEDKANHASRGRTKRTEIMFGPPGHLYVYLIYGMWWCMNVVTERDGYPAAVLIRGIELEGGERLLGPGRVCRALQVTGEMNGVDITKKNKIWFEMRGDLEGKIKTAPRVGVAYAGTWAKKPWRFIKD